MSAHTSAPWTVVQSAYGDPIVQASDGLTVARLSFERPSEAREANAQLIATAPELLTALRNLIAAMDDRDYRLMESTPARAAVAKAEGRSV